jgi:hypothetical protein
MLRQTFMYDLNVKFSHSRSKTVCVMGIMIPDIFICLATLARCECNLVVIKTRFGSTSLVKAAVTGLMVSHTIQASACSKLEYVDIVDAVYDEIGRLILLGLLPFFSSIF